MTQYVVEGSNGVPGVADMRYSVSFNGNSGRVLNLIVRPFNNNSFAYRYASVSKIEGTDDHYRIKFLGNGYAGHYLACYGERNERKVMIPAWFAGIASSKVSMADTHIRVFNWFYEDGNLIVDVVLGKSRHVMVSEATSENIPSVQIESPISTNDNVVIISVSQPEIVVDNMIAACRRNNIAFQLAA